MCSAGQRVSLTITGPGPSFFLLPTVRDRCIYRNSAGVLVFLPAVKRGSKMWTWTDCISEIHVTFFDLTRYIADKGTDRWTRSLLELQGCKEVNLHFHSVMFLGLLDNVHNDNPSFSVSKNNWLRHRESELSICCATSFWSYFFIPITHSLPRS